VYDEFFLIHNNNYYYHELLIYFGCFKCSVVPCVFVVNNKVTGTDAFLVAVVQVNYIVVV